MNFENKYLTGKSCSFSLKETENCNIVKFTGRIFTEYDDMLLFENEITKKCKKNKHVILDLSNVEYMNSRGLKEIIVLYNSKKTTEYKLVLAGISGEVEQLLEEMNLPSEITVISSVSNAANYF